MRDSHKSESTIFPQSQKRREEKRAFIYIKDTNMNTKAVNTLDRSVAKLGEEVVPGQENQSLQRINPIF